MYITINNLVGEKKVDLSYSILGSRREIAVISLFSDNLQYEVEEPGLTMQLGNVEAKKLKGGVYSGKELTDILEGKIDSKKFSENSKVKTTNKLSGITEINLNLTELDNTENLEDGRPSNTLFRYHVTSSKDFTSFEPRTPQYKRLKAGEIVYLTFKITNQNNKFMSHGVSLVLHVR